MESEKIKKKEEEKKENPQSCPHGRESSPSWVLVTQDGPRPQQSSYCCKGGKRTKKSDTARHSIIIIMPNVGWQPRTRTAGPRSKVRYGPVLRWWWFVETAFPQPGTDVLRHDEAFAEQCRVLDDYPTPQNAGKQLNRQQRSREKARAGRVGEIGDQPTKQGLL